MAYTAEQRDIINRIIRRGRQRGATKAQIKAALETGAVESNFRNLNHGDADSKGWRQERASLYKNPTNVDAGIDRFYNEAKGMRGSSGSIAARVQRPAAQYRGRYAQNSRLAENLLRGGGGAGSGGGSKTTTKTSYDKSALLQALVKGASPSQLAYEMVNMPKNTTTETRKVRASGGGQTSSGGSRGTAFGSKFRLRHTSGYRDPAHNAAVGGVPNSAHTRKDKKGRPAAEDYVGSESAMQKAAKEARRRGAKQVLVHDAGSGRHLHIEW
jgi:hypothetical protein